MTAGGVCGDCARKSPDAVRGFPILVTFLILRGIGLFTKLRIPGADLEMGDVAAHGEEAGPSGELVRVGGRAGTRPPRAPDRAGGRQREPQKVPGESETGGMSIIQ